MRLRLRLDQEPWDVESPILTKLTIEFRIPSDDVPKKIPISSQSVAH